MADRRFLLAGARPGVVLLLLIACCAGCQPSRPVSSRKLFNHQAMISFSGLNRPATVDDVRTSLATPRDWELMAPKSTPLYTHQQWRSPSTHTGVGVVLAHLPLPLSARFVVWLARQEYAKQAQDGRVLQEQVDALGRYWFEAENGKYHIRGYVIAQGFSAWIVYVGYRTSYTPDVGEIALASRSLESAVPMLDNAAAPTPPPTPPTTRPSETAQP